MAKIKALPGKKGNVAAMLQTKVALRALQTFDKASGVVVLIVWGAALVLSGLSYLSVEQTVRARRDIAEAQQSQPRMPEIRQEPIDTATLGQMSDKLNKRYSSKLQVSSGGGEIKLSASTPDSYQAFMGAIAYLDTITPEISWTIKDFCVGPECKEGLMTMHMAGAKVSFAAPADRDE